MFGHCAVFLVAAMTVYAGPIARQVGVSDDIRVLTVNGTQDCENEGNIYENGDRITDNANPCEDCYCVTGEVTCSVINCSPTPPGCIAVPVKGECCPSINCSLRVIELEKAVLEDLLKQSVSEAKVQTEAEVTTGFADEFTTEENIKASEIETIQEKAEESDFYQINHDSKLEEYETVDQQTQAAGFTEEISATEDSNTELEQTATPSYYSLVDDNAETVESTTTADIMLDLNTETTEINEILSEEISPNEDFLKEADHTSAPANAQLLEDDSELEESATVVSEMLIDKIRADTNLLAETTQTSIEELFDDHTVMTESADLANERFAEEIGTDEDILNDAVETTSPAVDQLLDEDSERADSTTVTNEMLTEGISTYENPLEEISQTDAPDIFQLYNDHTDKSESIGKIKERRTEIVSAKEDQIKQAAQTAAPETDESIEEHTKVSESATIGSERLTEEIRDDGDSFKELSKTVVPSNDDPLYEPTTKFPLDLEESEDKFWMSLLLNENQEDPTKIVEPKETLSSNLKYTKISEVKFIGNIKSDTKFAGKDEVKKIYKIRVKPVSSIFDSSEDSSFNEKKETVTEEIPSLIETEILETSNINDNHKVEKNKKLEVEPTENENKANVFIGKQEESTIATTDSGIVEDSTQPAEEKILLAKNDDIVDKIYKSNVAQVPDLENKNEVIISKIDTHVESNANREITAEPSSFVQSDSENENITTETYSDISVTTLEAEVQMDVREDDTTTEIPQENNEVKDKFQENNLSAKDASIKVKILETEEAQELVPEMNEVAAQGTHLLNDVKLGEKLTNDVALVEEYNTETTLPSLDEETVITESSYGEALKENIDKRTESTESETLMEKIDSRTESTEEISVPPSVTLFNESNNEVVNETESDKLSNSDNTKDASLVNDGVNADITSNFAKDDGTTETSTTTEEINLNEELESQTAEDLVPAPENDSHLVDNIHTLDKDNVEDLGKEELSLDDTVTEPITSSSPAMESNTITENSDHTLSMGDENIDTTVNPIEPTDNMEEKVIEANSAPELSNPELIGSNFMQIIKETLNQNDAQIESDKEKENIETIMEPTQFENLEVVVNEEGAAVNPSESSENGDEESESKKLSPKAPVTELMGSNFMQRIRETQNQENAQAVEPGNEDSVKVILQQSSDNLKKVTEKEDTSVIPTELVGEGEKKLDKVNSASKLLTTERLGFNFMQRIRESLNQQDAKIIELPNKQENKKETLAPTTLESSIDENKSKDSSKPITESKLNNLQKHNENEELTTEKENEKNTFLNQSNVTEAEKPQRINHQFVHLARKYGLRPLTKRTFRDDIKLRKKNRKRNRTLSVKWQNQ